MTDDNIDPLIAARQERVRQRAEQPNTLDSGVDPLIEARQERVRQRQGDAAVITGAAQTPVVNMESPGAHPITRLKVEYLSDNPAEMQRAIRNHYGPDAVLVRGVDLGFEADSPEGRSTFFSTNYDQPFQVFDPTAELQSRRAGGGLSGAGAFALEVGAEAVETIPQFAPEIAVEAALLARTRGGGHMIRGLERARRAEMAGRRLVGGAARTGIMAGTAASAVSLGDAVRQGTQALAGTQDQSVNELLAQNFEQAAMAGGLSAFFSGVGILGGRGVDLVLGRASPEGAASLNAAREFNEAIARGQISPEQVSEIALPLAGYYSNSPLTKRIFGYLGRLSPEISLYQRNMRAQLDLLAEAMSNENVPTAIAAANSELIGALSTLNVDLMARLTRNAGAADSTLAGVDALAHIGAYKTQTAETASLLYDDAYATMAREFEGREFTLRYNWSALREARNAADAQRNLPAQRFDPPTGQPGIEGRWVDETIGVTPGDTSAWRAYDRVNSIIDPIIRGQTRVPPRTIVSLIEIINDELANAPIADRGRANLLNLKASLNGALDSIPEMNAGLGVESIERLRAAQQFYSNRARTLEDAGIYALTNLEGGRDYYRAAAQLFENNDPNRIRQFRDVVLQTPRGDEHWNEVRNNYLVHTLNQTSNPGSAWNRWNTMQADVKSILFPDAGERAQVARALRDLDLIHTSVGFNAVQDAAETSSNFVSDVVGRISSDQGTRDATRLVREAITNATNAGNPMPQRAFDAGVWQNVMETARTQTSEGQFYIDPTALNREMRNLRRSGVLDMMSPESHAFLENFQELALASTFDLRDGGAGLAAAQFAADLIDPSRAPSAAMKLLSLRTISTGLVAANPQLARYASSAGQTTGTNFPTFLARMGYYYAADENQVTASEWNEYMQALRRAEQRNSLTPEQEGMLARGLGLGRRAQIMENN